jgi:hypothetical protein
MEVKLYSFLTSSIDGGEWPASRYGHFMPWKKEYPVTIEKEREGGLRT